MKTRKIFGIALITACFALCAAVRPQNEVGEEVSAIPTVTAPEETVGGFETEVEMTETEKAEIPRRELAEQAAPEAKPAPAEAPAVPDIQPTPESEAVAEQTTKSPRNQEIIESPSDDMVYVPGFGWIQSESPNHVEYAGDMYENGNKIGIMG